MDRKNAIEYITHHSWSQSRLGLGRIARLCALLGNPQDKLRFIHVAGTNGKSSVCSLFAGVFAAAGVRTGLFTSPYINRFNERMQVDGVEITDEEIAELTAYVRGFAEQMEDHPTEFELITAIAFEWFLRKGCRLVVLEVGLGGRLDATNVIGTPELAVITTIDWDHTEQLGNSLPAIAAEKAGIIKAGGQVLLYPQPPKVEAVFEAACASRGARLAKADLTGLVPEEHDLAGQRFSYGAHRHLDIQLLGPYQCSNAALVICGVELMGRMGWPVSEQQLRAGLAGVRWPARFEVVRAEKPAVIVDGGHNPQCVRELVKSLEAYFPGQKVVFIAGVMADKDYEAMFKLVLPVAERVFCVTPNNPRALPARQLAGVFRTAGFEAAQACDSIPGAVEAALAASGGVLPVCAFGSFYMAGDIRACFPAGR